MILGDFFFHFSPKLIFSKKNQLFNAQLHMGIYHHAEFQKKLMGQS